MPAPPLCCPRSLKEEDEEVRKASWKSILEDVHNSAMDVPFSGKQNPTVLNKRLSGYVDGQQQFDYPLHTIMANEGPNSITVSPGAQTGLFRSAGPLEAHGYRPNEFFSNNFVYEGLVKYGADGGWLG